MADVTLNIRHNADQATSSVKSLSNAMGSFASNSKKASTNGTAAANGFKKIGQACLSAGRSATKGASGLSKFASSIGRIAFYRAIRSAIRYVTDSFKQGLEAAYNWSKEQGGANAKLAGAMDALSAASGRMKLQLGAAFGGLIVAIEPILIRIINLVTQAAEAITRFFAVLNGTGYYKKAAEGFEEVGASAGGAGKKIKGLLASWDELNVIGKESGGGGGGSSATDYSGAYVWEKAESDWANLFASGDFFGIGAKIGDALGNISTKITEFLKKPAIQNFGKNLAAALNGSVSNPENWENFGEATGTFLATIITNIADFFNNVNWDDVKTAIKAFWDGFKQALYDNTYLDENIQTMKDNFSLIMAWFDDLPAKAKNIGIKIANAVIREVENGINEVVNVYNGTWLADILGELDPVHFELIPEIPEEELNANWNKAAEEIRRRSQENPVSVTVDAVAGQQLDGTELFQSGTAYRPSGSTVGKKVGVGVVTVPSVGDKLNGTELFESGVADRPSSGHGKKVGVGVAVVPIVDGTVDVNVGLKKEGWDTVTGWVNNNFMGGDVWSSVRLMRGSGFTTVTDWINRNFLGGAVWEKVGLTRGGMFTTVADWIKISFMGGTVWKNIGLSRGGWSTVTDWINRNFLGGAVTKVVSVVATLTNAAALEKSITEAVSGITVKLKTTVNGKTSVFGKLSTSAYAQGGFPEPGELFIARESGPELVGSMNGNTAVANNDQIVAGIQSGVAQANAEQNELLRQQNSILMQLLNKDLTISPSVALGQVVARSTALYGRA